MAFFINECVNKMPKAYRREWHRKKMRDIGIMKEPHLYII